MDIDVGLPIEHALYIILRLVAQRRISRSSAGYTRAPHQGPKQGKGYQGFDPMGGLNL